LFHGRIHYVVAPNEGLTPLAPIAPGFHRRKPIAFYQRGRAACDSDRALDLILVNAVAPALKSEPRTQKGPQIQRGRSRMEYGRLDRPMSASFGANREGFRG
jgi:hypothetical protein